MTVRASTNRRPFVTTNVGAMRLWGISRHHRKRIPGLSMAVTGNAILTVKMVDAVACVDVNKRLSMTDLANAIIGFFTTDIGSGEYYLLVFSTVRRIYLTSYMLDIRAIVASLRILLLPRIVADITILNMVIFGDSKRP